MWIAEWPPAKDLSDGSASMTTNPFADYHLMYAVALCAAGVGATWDLGTAWARLPLVSRHRWLLRPAPVPRIVGSARGLGCAGRPFVVATRPKASGAWPR